MKIGIVVDSSCGLTKKQAEKKGWHYLPLYITIDGNEYKDGVEISPSTLTDFYKSDSKVSTAATPIGFVDDLFDKLSKEYDQVIVYPISKHLSSQYQNLKVIAKKEKYSNIHIIESIGVTHLILDDLLKFEHDIKNNEITYKQGINRMADPKLKEKSIVYLIPKTNDALLNGGRLTPAAHKIASLLKIVPIISFKEGKLEKHGKGRVFDKTLTKTFDAYWKEVDKFLDKSKPYSLIINHVKNQDIDNIVSRFKEMHSNLNIKIIPTPSVIGIHTGLESIAISIIENSELLDNLIDELN